MFFAFSWLDGVENAWAQGAAEMACECWMLPPLGRGTQRGGLKKAYLSDPPNVLIAALLVKAQVLVQSEPHIVSVKSVRGKALVEKVLLESCGDGGLARGRETGEPDCQAALLAVLVALTARQRWVPCDVAAVQSSV